MISAARIVIGKKAGDSKPKVAWQKNKLDIVQKVELPIARVVQIGAKTNKKMANVGKKGYFEKLNLAKIGQMVSLKNTQWGDIWQNVGT